MATAEGRTLAPLVAWLRFMHDDPRRAATIIANSGRVFLGLSDPNPMPHFRLIRWLP